MAERNGYIGRAPGDSSIVLAKQYFQPTGAGKTFTFAAGYDPGLVDVYRNGVKLINVLDYAATDGKNIVLDTPVGVGSTVQVVAYKGFNLTQINSSNADFTVGSNLYVQSGFGSFAQGINANQINVTGIGTIGIGSFTDINVSGGATVVGTVVAGSFSGDGSALTGVANTDYVVSVASTTGLLNVTGTTDSTSSTTGSVTIAGGVGIAKNVYIGAGLSVAGTLTYEDVTNVDSVGLITAKSGVNVSGGQVTIGTGITMGIAGVATFSGTSDVHLLDNVRLNVGDGSDLAIYHNGSNSYITGANTGNLLLQAHGNIKLMPANGEDAVEAVANDAVKLYYNNSQKFQTTNDGTSVTGIATATVGIDAAISVWTLGASGTDHYTFTGPGNLSATTDPTLNLKRGQKYTFKNRSGGHPFRIQSTPNGSAGTAYNTGVTNNDGGDGTNIIFDVPHNAPNVLYYQCTSHGNMGGAMYIDGSAYEISIGAGITFGSAGVSTFSGTADIHLLDNVQLNVGDGSDLVIKHDGSHSYVQDSGTGNLYLRTNGAGVVIDDGSNTFARFLNGNACDFNFNGSKKFETTNDGTVTTGIATATGGLAINADSKNLTIGASEDLKLFHDGSHSVIHEDGTGGLKFVSANSFQFRDTDKDTGDYLINANIDGAVSLYYNGNSKFETTNDGTVTTGIATVTQGLNTDGLLSEKFNTTAGKLSANTNIDLEDGMVHYFSTQETTTSTPNIRYSSSKTLNNMLSIGDAITVTIITTAAAAGYSAQMNIDGSGQTEEWVGGEAPSAGGSDGLDIYTYNILKTSNATFKVIGNYVNATN